jgi:S-adenosyl-L-methionine hydrolase (adenosine-forming)
MKRPIITFTSDFGVQSQGVGIMEAVALGINPEARIIHLMHGLPDFNLNYAARIMETLASIPTGIHVCVVDPGVGTNRKAIIIKCKRGDYIIGPDNGVLISGANFLGGITKIVEISNEKYMRIPVSPIFHGRDIFAPAAAFLSKGISIEKFGNEIAERELVKAPYPEAEIQGNEIQSEIISINKFGSMHLNITWETWDDFGINLGEKIDLFLKDRKIRIPFKTTFGDVEKGKPLIIKDDYGRIEIAINQGSFFKKYKLKIGDEIVIRK